MLDHKQLVSGYYLLIISLSNKENKAGLVGRETVLIRCKIIYTIFSLICIEPPQKHYLERRVN